MPGIGEPRDFIVEVNKTISHISVTNAGQGYSVPVDVKLIGGYPEQSELRQHLETNGSAYEFRHAVISVDEVDENGTITRLSLDDPGIGYTSTPQVIISGGGGYGAWATVFVWNGEVIGWEIEAGGKGYYNLDSSNIPSTEIPLEPGSPLGVRKLMQVLRYALGEA